MADATYGASSPRRLHRARGTCSAAGRQRPTLTVLATHTGGPHVASLASHTLAFLFVSHSNYRRTKRLYIVSRIYFRSGAVLTHVLSRLPVLLTRVLAVATADAPHGTRRYPSVLRDGPSPFPSPSYFLYTPDSLRPPCCNKNRSAHKELRLRGARVQKAVCDEIERGATKRTPHPYTSLGSGSHHSPKTRAPIPDSPVGGGTSCHHMPANRADL